ncbi:MAG: hypothetical protein QCI82_10175 [Candidatus Thermoplasmatota archaeon]|nr:hypothetical protein [Candidatus Thermoplasmatota archaeon]
MFRKVEKYSGKQCLCEAFSIKLVVPKDWQKDDQAMMAARLTGETFKGPIVDSYKKFLEKISGK